MKIATWNVNSIIARLPLVVRWLEESKPDALCLQEIKCADEKFPAEAFQELGYRSVTFGQPTYNGVAIISRGECRNLQRGFSSDEAGAQARLLAATIEGVRVVNVYIPNGAFVGSDKYSFKLEWMKRLREFFDSGYKKKEQVLLCGDFNVAPEERDVHDPKLWEGHVLFSKPERAALDLIKQWGFQDAFRLLHPKEKQFSWWDYRQGSFRRNFGLRIDHIWVSKPLAERTKAVFIEKHTRAWERPSDHAPVVIEIE
jgi:exodeoxyribonuclease III